MRATQAWGDATIKTLLGRLMRKGAVRSVREDGRQLYHPKVDRRAYLDDEVRQLADRLFDGDLAAFSRHLAEMAAGPG